MAERINSIRTFPVPPTASKAPRRVQTIPHPPPVETKPATGQPFPIWMIGLMGGVGLLFLVTIAVLFTQQASPPLDTSGPEDLILNPPSTATPSCTSVTDKYAAIILEFQQKGQWQQAVDTATLALNTDGLCSDERQVFAELLISSGLEAIYAEQMPPQDRSAAEATVERYLKLQRQATEYGISFPATHIQVAQRVYKSQNFLLAKIAFDQAIEADQMTSTDLELMQQYCSTLYNLGYWGVKDSKKESESYKQGVEMLVASQMINKRYSLNILEASAELKRLYGPEESWPTKPVETPLLPSSQS